MPILSRSGVAVAALACALAACGGTVATSPSPVAIATQGATDSPSTAPSASTAPSPAGARLSGRILFRRLPDTGPAEPFSIDPDGADPKPVEAGSPEIANVSPDGSLVAEMFLEGGHFAKILRPDGTLVRTLDLPDQTLGLACFAWSPDSTRLACEGWDDTQPGRVGLYTVRVSDGSDLRQLTAPADHHHDQGALYSVDRSQIWYVHSTDETAEQGELWAVNVDGSDEHRLTDAPVGWGLKISPDRRWLTTAADGFVKVFDAKDLSSPPTRLPIPDGWAVDVAWSPDGSHLAVMASIVAVGDNRIGVMAADGSDFHVVPTGPGKVDLIGWRP